MNAYVAGGWGVTALMVALYAWRTIRRGRALGQRMPPGEQTWR